MDKSSVNGLSSFNCSVRAVYKALCEDVEMTQMGLASKLHLARSSVAVATATLIKYGFIRRVGPKKGGHWEVIK